MVIPRFVAQALAGEDITVYGDGTQSRCFGYVGDVVGAFAALMDEPEAVGRVFNVGNDGEITMMELADMVNDACGGRSAIRMVPFAEAYDEHFEDMQRRVPDLSKIKALTGYAPTLDTAAIVRRVVDWTRARG